MVKFLSDYYKGKKGLAMSFWVWPLVITFLLIAPVGLAMIGLDKFSIASPGKDYGAIFFACVMLFLGYLNNMAVFNAAKYNRDRGFFGWIATILAVIGLINVFFLAYQSINTFPLTYNDADRIFGQNKGFFLEYKYHAKEFYGLKNPAPSKPKSINNSSSTIIYHGDNLEIIFHDTPKNDLYEQSEYPENAENLDEFISNIKSVLPIEEDGLNFVDLDFDESSGTINLYFEVIDSAAIKAMKETKELYKKSVYDGVYKSKCAGFESYIDFDQVDNLNIIYLYLGGKIETKISKMQCGY